MQQTGVRSLVWEDPLERGMATHSSILTWENPWTEEPGRLQSMGSQRVRHNLETKQQEDHFTGKPGECGFPLSVSQNLPCYPLT